jgi:DtxR family Mn-dependent transcriptional regulator
MKQILTQSIEDYLKAIYELTRQEKRASTTNLAERLEVTPASITGMIQKLAATNPPLVEYQKHHGVALTDEGQNVALETIRHHRLLEMFLHQMLGYPWDEVHEEADRLEHVISEQFEESISVALGNPMHDPHGDPIPRQDLSLPEMPETPLSAMRPNQHATIMRVRDDDPALLRFLSDMSLVPGAKVLVTDYSKFDGNLYIQINDSEEKNVLGSRVTSQIFVNLHP